MNKQKIKEIVRYVLMFVLLFDVIFNLMAFKDNIYYVEQDFNIQNAESFNIDDMFKDDNLIDIENKINVIHEMSFQRDKTLLNLIFDLWLFLMIRYGRPNYLRQDG